MINARLFLPYAVLAAVLAALCSCSREPAAIPSGQTVRAGQQLFVPDVLTVCFDEEAAAQLEKALSGGTLPEYLQAAGVVAAERSFPYDEEWEGRHRQFGLHLWYRLKVTDRSLTKAAGDISGLPGVVNAEPVRRSRPASFFNDPRAYSQWAIKNPGSPADTYTPGIDVNAEPVWAHFTAGSRDVIVAVIDQGVDMKHEDLQGVCIPAGADGSHNFIPGDKETYIPAGDHGTHVAGIIAAVNNNGKGICGVAGGDGVTPGVRILSCVVFRDDESSEDGSISGYTDKALVWAADHGAVIANNSWGYVYDSADDAKRGGVGREMGAAIDYFIENAGCDGQGNQREDSPMKGGVVLFAAGNEGWAYGWPAQDSRVIAVGSVASSGARAYYSNYGSWVDVSAPGGDLKLGPGIVSTTAGNNYASLQGTSMACPYASGVAALILSRYGGPGFTNAMLTERLIKGARPMQSPDLAPLVDAMGSICLGGTIPPDPVEGLTARGRADNIDLSFPVPADEDDGRAYGFRIVVARDGNYLLRLNPTILPVDVVGEDVFTGTVKTGEEYETVLEKLEFSTGYYIRVFAFDYNRNYSAGSEIVYVETGVNSPPVIETDWSGSVGVKAHEVFRTTLRYHDPDGHEVSISVSPGSNACRPNIESGKITLVITGNAAPEGRYTAEATITDSYGAASSCSLEYELLENHPPVLVKPLENILFDRKEEVRTVLLSDFFADEDGEDLKYAITQSESKVAALSCSGSTLEVRASEFGFTDVNVVGTDARGYKVESDFRILVRDPAYPYDVFPNPASTTLYVRPVESGTLEYVLSGKAGAVVMSGSSEASLFEPLELDVSGLPSGTYTLRLKGCGLDTSATVVKI